MRGGKLRKRLDVQQYATTRDTDGGILRTWTLLRTVWGMIEPMNGVEKWFGKQVSAELTHRITIRYFKNLNSAMRFVYHPPGASASRTFNIRDITNIEERSIQQVCMCIEGAPIEQ